MAIVAAIEIMNLSSITSRASARNRRACGFTIAEVVAALAITTIAFAGIIRCYTQCTRRAQWSGYSLAAQALANKELEQARAAIWDDATTNNEILNLNLNNWTYNSGTKVGTGWTLAPLDIPITGTNNIVATNFVTVRTVNLNNSTTPLVQVQMVQVDTVWPFKFGGTRWYTNSIANYFAPDNRDANDL